MKRINKHIGWLFILLFALNVNAQKEYKYFEYQALGLKLGGTYSGIALQPAISDLKSEMSYSGGLVYVFSDKKYIGVQMEALFSSRKWSEGFDNYQATTELRYIELPLMTNINLGLGKLKYILNLGTYFALRLDKDLQTNMPEDHEQYEALINRSESGADFGLLLGGAIRYLSPFGIIQLDMRYTYGYQKIYEEESTGFKYSNMSGFNIGLIYMINLNKNEK